MTQLLNQTTSSPPLLDAEGQRFIDDLLSQMTLGEKIGQMTQPEKNSVKPGDVARLGLGSVLSGGGGNPEPNTPESWREMVMAFKREARTSRLGIPLIYGVDAVHGHNNVVGATIFPHNIGLGAARDADLVRRIGRATAREVSATGVRWDFAPAVSIPQDIRWGRSYEGFSQSSEVVSELASAFVTGLIGGGQSDPTGVLPSVKHFVADAATTWGTSKRVDRDALAVDRTLGIAEMGQSFVELIDLGAWSSDQGDSQIDEATLRAVHLPPYRAALAAGALNVMASYSSWQGLKLHAHHFLLTELLKGELGFQGFVVSDWEGVQQVDPDFDTAVITSINAGMDMVMVPFDYQKFIDAMQRAVEGGQIAQSRIDDAVRRILSVKYMTGLFDEPEEPALPLSVLGSSEHRALAREAVQKSLVLLKNEGGALPLDPASPLLVMGQAADDLGAQCGGWTITWMGGHGETTTGTTILAGLRASVPNPETIRYAPDAEGDERYDIGLVVLAEEPYAEGMGDRSSLELRSEQVALLKRARQRCQKLAVVLLSGRPQIITGQLPEWDALVAAWLPGSEGQGVADVLLGAVPFTGRLEYTWPSRNDDIVNAQQPLFRPGEQLKN
ncbi:glycoside hydrolase family 3 protein [Deinococcus sp.]|uniref:glycoside hydrolase family 3 protein n=1 Tax=Deinococcus sp. TaxID=47478 RepID=UPI003B5AB9DE